MEAIMLIISFAFAIWAISHICQKKQGVFSKIFKSLFSFLYFLISGSISAIPGCLPISIIMFLIGWAVVNYYNRLHEKKKVSSEKIFREHKEALRAYEVEEAILNFTTDNPSHRVTPTNLQPQKIKRRGKKNLPAELSYQLLTKIAFLYTNAKGETKFRDVDVISYYGYYLKGYCYLAREMRTFILDRIDGNVIIRETGEAVDPYEWADMMEFA